MNTLKNNKRTLIGIGVFILFMLYNFCQDIPLALMGIKYNEMSLNSKIIYLLIYELIFCLSLILIFNKEYIENCKDFFKNFKSYFKNYFKFWPFAYGLMLVSNLIILTIFPESTANNQEIVMEQFKMAPVYMLISSVIFAPLIEELVFRLGFRYMFSSDKMFIIMSGLVFGSLHVVGSFTSFINLIYIIPYSIPGFIFAYTLVKSKNIFVPTMLHFINNGFAMLLQVILMFL